MPSDIADVLAQTGLTPNDDNQDNALLSQIDIDLLLEVQEDLKDDYDIALSFEEIVHIMEAKGIDFGFEGNYTVAELIYDSLEEDN